MKPRWHSEKQLIDEINKAHRDSKLLLLSADSKEAEGRFILSNTGHEIGKIYIQEAQKMRKRATSLIENRARRLGEALSVMRTEMLPMPEINPQDKSIPR